MFQLKRRAVLQALGGLALGLPILSSGGRHARADERPKRLILLYNENGTINNAFNPTVNGDGTITPGAILAPLQPHLDDIIVVRGLDNEAAYNGGDVSGGGHSSGTATLWTGTEQSTTFVNTNNGETAGWGGGISVDRHIAKSLAAPTKFESLEFGVQTQQGAIPLDVGRYMSYNGEGDEVPPEDNPTAMFTRLYAELLLPPDELARLQAERATVLDAVSADLTSLSARLGAGDRARLDEHTAALRELEARLGTAIGACEVPAIDAVGDPEANASFPAVSKAQMDLLAGALACDLTRVASVMWSTAGSRTVFDWLNDPNGNPISGVHHSLSHEEAQYEQELITIQTWYAEQVAYLIQLLKDKQEPDGSSLFDHTVIVWANALEAGQDHSRRNLPIVVAGRAGLNTQAGGKLVDYGGARKTNDLLVTLCQLMGLADTTFGNPVYCTGALSEVW